MKCFAFFCTIGAKFTATHQQIGLFFFCFFLSLHHNAKYVSPPFVMKGPGSGARIVLSINTGQHPVAYHGS